MLIHAATISLEYKGGIQSVFVHKKLVPSLPNGNNDFRLKKMAIKHDPISYMYACAVSNAWPLTQINPSRIA